MRVTIIPEDNFVSVDGVGKNFDFQVDPNITSVQWYDDRGTVGLRVGGSRHIDNLDEFEAIVNIYHTI